MILSHKEAIRCVATQAVKLGIEDGKMNDVAIFCIIEAIKRQHFQSKRMATLATREFLKKRFQEVAE